MALNVQQRVAVAASIGWLAQAIEQAAQVALADLGQVSRRAQVGEQPARLAVAGNAVRHQQILVPGMECDQAARRQAGRQQPPPIGVGEHLIQEGFPPSRIVQAAVFLGRKPGQALQQAAGIGPAPRPARRAAIGGVNFHPPQPAAGRALHEDVAEHCAELPGAMPSVIRQGFGDIQLGVFQAQHPRGVRVAHQPHRRAGNAQADAQLGAYWPEGQQPGEGFCRQGRSRIAAVIAHRPASQAFADGHRQGRRRRWRQAALCIQEGIRAQWVAWHKIRIKPRAHGSGLAAGAGDGGAPRGRRPAIGPGPALRPAGGWTSWLRSGPT